MTVHTEGPLYRDDGDSSTAALRASARNDYDPQSGSRRTLSPEQLAAVRARAPLVTVSAGAGSGKTTVLVERFIDLVENDAVSPLEILAITFTEKAAAEMKERIVRRFEERGDTANRRLAEAAYISTIHGFCSRILREHPLVAKLDPSFRVMDEVTRNVFLDEYLELLYRDEWFVESEGLITKRFESMRPRLFELIVEAAFLPDEFGTAVEREEGLTLDGHVENAIRRIREHWDARWAVAREQLLSVAPTILSAVVTGARNPKLHAQMCAVVERLRRDATPDLELAQRFVGSTGFTGSVQGETQADAIRAVFQAVRPIFKEYTEIDFAAIEQQEREIFAPLKVGIYERARDLARKYEEFKRQHGLLDFADMQRRALELLDDATVRENYARRFKHIVLDEAQDTNDVQMRLIDRLRDGRQSLFAVGDVKQSIYGFRGANVEIFQSLCRSSTPPLRGSARNDGVALSLTDNYRSRDGVIDFVNELGRRFWSDDEIEYEPLSAKFDYQARGAEPQVDVWFVDQPDIIDENGKEKREPVDETREREGVAIAAWIRGAVDGTEPLVVYDRATDSYRAARYGDIAILSNTRNPFPAFERALADLGIPFVKDGGREFFSGREVRDILAALRVLENPLDDVSLLTALRSPLFGWGDRDLARLRTVAGGRALWYGLREIQPEGSTADPSAYRTIRRLRRQATFTSPVGLIELVCDVTAYRAALLCLPRGRAHVANIDKLIEFARATAMLDGASLTSFLHRATLAERYLGNETDAPASGVGDDAVVLSTIHGAKGLEWPVVILAGLDSDYARTEVTSRYYAPEGALILQIKRDDEEKPLRSAANAALIAAAKVRDEAEGRRLFYVGMTRARERLILTSTYRYQEPRYEPNRLEKPVRWLAAALGVEESLEEARIQHLGASTLRVECYPPDRIARMRNSVARELDAALQAARQAIREGRPVEWPLPNGSGDAVDTIVSRVASRAARDESNRALAVATVTQLAYFFRCPLVYYFDLVLQVDENPRGLAKAGSTGERRLTALQRGTRVHELLERADFSAPPDTEVTRLVSQVDDVSPDELLKIRALLQNVLADPLIHRVRSAARIEREYGFFLDLGGTTVQGVIDLVFEDTEGRGVVVDYKSNDLAGPGRLAVLTELYRPQIELYALAAKRAGLIEPDEGTLYFLNKAQPVSLPVDAERLEAAEERAADALSRIARSAWDTEPGEKCRGCGYRKRGYCEVGKRFED
jgi:ATP-dependent helicase/nuclease subunit A